MSVIGILQPLSLPERLRPKAFGQASQLEVIPVTATPRNFPHTSIMERAMDEAEYVLAALYRMRDEVSANPSLFNPEAQERIDEAIVRIRTEGPPNISLPTGTLERLR